NRLVGNLGSRLVLLWESVVPTVVHCLLVPFSVVSLRSVGITKGTVWFHQGVSFPGGPPVLSVGRKASPFPFPYLVSGRDLVFFLLMVSATVAKTGVGL